MNYYLNFILNYLVLIIKKNSSSISLYKKFINIIFKNKGMTKMSNTKIINLINIKDKFIFFIVK